MLTHTVGYYFLLLIPRCYTVTVVTAASLPSTDRSTVFDRWRPAIRTDCNICMVPWAHARSWPTHTQTTLRQDMRGNRPHLALLVVLAMRTNDIMMKQTYILELEATEFQVHVQVWRSCASCVDGPRRLQSTHTQTQHQALIAQFVPLFVHCFLHAVFHWIAQFPPDKLPVSPL